MAVIGLFVTPQNTAAIPHATTSGIGSPNIGARKLPSEAPTNMAGAISPPLNPAPRDTAVNSIFSRNTYHGAETNSKSGIWLIPVPRYSFDCNTSVRSATIPPPTAIIKYWFFNTALKNFENVSNAIM